MLSLSASELLHLKEVLGQKQPGHGLPRPLYHDELVYRSEMQYIWRQGWLFAGHSCEIPNPGDYFVYDVDGDSVIVVRDNEGQVHALFNVCRHRGSIICEEPEGHVKRFICPYHQWTYALDGHLLVWRGMQEGLDKAQLGLHAAHAREMEGLVFIRPISSPLIRRLRRPRALRASRARKLPRLWISILSRIGSLSGKTTVSATTAT